jgi:hypothetical protein
MVMNPLEKVMLNSIALMMKSTLAIFWTKQKKFMTLRSKILLMQLNILPYVSSKIVKINYALYLRDIVSFGGVSKMLVY